MVLCSRWSFVASAVGMASIGWSSSSCIKRWQMELCEFRCCSIPSWAATRPALFSSQGVWAKNSANLPHPSARGPTCVCTVVWIIVPILSASWVEVVALSFSGFCWEKLPPVGWNQGVCVAAARSQCKICRCISCVAKVCKLCLLDCAGPGAVSVCPCPSPKGWSWADQEALAAGATLPSVALCRDSMGFRECCTAGEAFCMECVLESA